MAVLAVRDVWNGAGGTPSAPSGGANSATRQPLAARICRFVRRLPNERDRKRVNVVEIGLTVAVHVRRIDSSCNLVPHSGQRSETRP
jgi:hypothetical protein